MPVKLERKLKREYGANSAIPYKVMNSLGYMRGNQETEKGKKLDMRHKNLGAYLHKSKKSK